MLTTILVLIGIILGIGVLIYIAFVVIPNKVKRLNETDGVRQPPLDLNCGDCGNAGCAAHPQAMKEPKALSCCGSGIKDDVLT
ncbi:hypothetical protein ACFLXP_05900 [Chloroflexota bacterium]